MKLHSDSASDSSSVAALYVCPGAVIEADVFASASGQCVVFIAVRQGDAHHRLA
jgi:hypothetical protein